MEPNETPEELLELRLKNTYKVPPEYFGELADEIMSRISLPVSAPLPLASPPAGYFDGLAGDILSKIKAGSGVNEVQAELEETDSFLSGISRINPYRVPDGYFESFAINIPAERSADRPAVKMRKRSPSAWTSWAVAAVITGILATSGILFLLNGEDKGGGYSNSYTQALAKVTDKEIADYLDNASSEADFTPVAQPERSAVNDSKSLYKLLLNSVSDNDIENYLHANSDGDETKNSKGI